MRIPKPPRLRRPSIVALGPRCGVAATLLSLLAGSALAASPPEEQIVRVTHVGHPAADLGVVESRLIFPPGSRWDADSEAGPLTLSVETGKVGVVLGGGLARIERDVTPLQADRIHRLEPGRMAFLWPGDTLVVVRGYALRVDNDETTVATTDVSRVVREPLPTVTRKEPSALPRPGHPR